MAEQATYEFLVKWINYRLKEEGISIQEFVEQRASDLISVQGMYNILRGGAVGKYTLIYEVVKRLDGELIFTKKLPEDFN